MTIGQIKALVAKYLHKPVTDFVAGTGATEVDMLLLALNNARKAAEKFHDFSVCRKRGYLSITTSASWATPTWFSVPSPTVVMRKVKNWSLRCSGTSADGEFGGVDRVLRAVTQDQLAQVYARQDYMDAPMHAADRYASDASVSTSDDPLLSQNFVIIDGQRASLNPVPTAAQTVIVDGYFWWTDWSLDANTDWWTTYGSEYLIFQTMVEANRLNSLFVSNLEGALPPPIKEAKEALAGLISLDQDSTEGSIHISDL